MGDGHLDIILWDCFRHFVHLDEANAAIHCAPVRYSPLTFRLAERLDTMGAYEGLSATEMLLLSRVIQDKGKYEEDKGR